MKAEQSSGGAGPREKIIILDFGGPEGMLVARRVREAQVYCELLPFNTSWAEIRRHQPRGIILAGGPGRGGAGAGPRCDPQLFKAQVPLLGIGYGMQLLALERGGEVEPDRLLKEGGGPLKIEEPEPLFQEQEGAAPDGFSGAGWRGLVKRVPPGFKVLARTEEGAVAAMGHPRDRLYGIAFNPAFPESRGGMHLLKRFLYDVCGCSADWTPRRFIDAAVEQIRQTVGPAERVVCGLSGGIDSSVVACLLDQAIGERCVSIFVDHGLLRKGEGEEVSRFFRERLRGPFIAVDARKRFLERLKGVTDPEAKRKIIGTEFINVFEEEARKLGEIAYLAQGTIYPDVIESGVGPGGTVIKSHHNVGGLPEKLGFKLIEPLRELFKDEVRLVARELGLPDRITNRQPFPGPGLGVRIIGEITAERLELVREADAILREEVEQAGLAGDLWQFFAVLIGVNAVGVKEERRHYGPVICLRAVTSTDAMTAAWARLPYDLLDRVSRRITGEIPGISRVVYDITAKPPGTIEWE
ncbi:MAG TPA: glutamine-hydrolyzing GMP synthase [Bacillota bacterium]|jgi:GMP synthase (glutamine-hydrolysing)|nr:glutamine-hydrolyzing GMP synthase [Bacillota bacterium]HOB86628.1 glutamine-hydrolyzing GMP synthase [Bacillota bacterium]HOP69197.1 glutamine-hydrolyzing GMP synthase [Bacillota bacterium]HPT34603.1 glutamine-hydrolyzing GMP synthase [Bacillota bacterium]HQD07073.1 glutamine-hydrolyzing GMP synthase [Bacillota bacterium]